MYYVPSEKHESCRYHLLLVCRHTGPQRPDGRRHRDVGWDNTKLDSTCLKGEASSGLQPLVAWEKAGPVVKEKAQIHLFR